jgi:hypothetical protein
MSSILSFVEPLESAVPAAEDLLTMAALMLRTAGGLGALIAMLMLFRPLLTGVWHALVITVKPRLSQQQRTSQGLQQKRQKPQEHCQSTSMSNHAADENNISPPDLESELPNLAALK